MLRVIRDEVCVNHRRLRWITQFEALIIFTIIYAINVSLCIQYQAGPILVCSIAHFVQY